MKNDATTNLFLATCGLITVIGIILLVLFTGCGGGGGDDDTSNCSTTGNCPDAGPMTADANPLAPDADTTPDAQNSDPCAAFIGHTDGWSCNAPDWPWFDCNFTLSVEDGQCFITCPGEFKCTTPAPSEMSSDNPFSCVEFGGFTIHCS